ncbi:MAG TPA: DegQ family serine endoprotease [Acidobacteriota bacterium]|nr:DegQ family serine endoprotease [Acidobacteriota bacterium]
MKATVISTGRWHVTVAMLIAFLLGGLAGSILTAKTGRAPLGVADTTPLLVAASSPVQTAQVSFASGFSAVAAKDVPSVVNIASTKVVRSPEGGQMSPFFADPFFRQFFGDQFTPQQQMPREEREHSLGSGVIVSADGYILTNNHVVDGASDIKVTLGDKREFKGHVIGTDPKTDIAVLKIEAKGLPALIFADSTKVRVGDFALAIGNPFGLSQTVTLGIISATGRGNLGIEDYEDFIQTDASINPGNSGGALVNVNGELIGINTAILSGDGGGNQGIGFAIPINMARQVMEQILKQGKVVRGYLGAMIQPVTPQIAKAFGLTKAQGALLGDVEPEGPAGKSGLQKGDIVLEVDGQPIIDTREFRLKVAMMKPGTTVKLKVFHNGIERTVDVALGAMPSKPSDKQGIEGSPSAALQGLSVDDLTPQIARQLGLPAKTFGVVVSSVQPGSAAQEADLRRGDVIQEVNRQPVHNVKEFSSAIGQLGKQDVLLLINRGGNTLYVVVEPH